LLGKPAKKLENPVFTLELYTCEKCGYSFKTAYYSFLPELDAIEH